jgi:DNA repair exonuclease SbcCD nuclease subunit
MRVACLADLHAHNYKEFDRKTDKTGSQRLDQIIDTLDYIQWYCIKEGIHTILFAGDAFHVRSRVNTIVFNAVYDKFKEICGHGITVIAIPGNHDDHDNSDLPPHSLHAFKDIDGMLIMDKPGFTLLEDGTPVVGVRYSKNVQMIKDFLNDETALWRQAEKQPILLAHVGVSGGLIGKGNYPMADAFTPDDLKPDVFKYIVLGHYHRRQFLGGLPNMLYCGAPIQHSFSDEGEDKGFYVINTDKRYDIDFVPVPNPQFITMNAYNVANEDMQLIADEGHYVRLQVTESELPVALTYLPPNLQYKVNLQREYKEQTRVDVKIGMSFEEIISKYADEFKPEAKAIGLKILREVQDGVDS